MRARALTLEVGGLVSGGARVAHAGDRRLACATTTSVDPHEPPPSGLFPTRTFGSPKTHAAELRVRSFSSTSRRSNRAGPIHVRCIARGLLRRERPSVSWGE